MINISNETCKSVLIIAFNEYLNKRFNGDLYQELILNTDFDYDINNYFKIYSEQINLSKGGRAYRFGNFQLTDLIFINYVIVIYKLKIDFHRDELKLITGLNDYETWLLNPVEFNYDKFDAKWLIDLHETIISGLKNNQKIKDSLNRELNKKFNPVLAELKYKHFM